MIASPVAKVTNRDMLIICTSRAKNTTCCNRLSRPPDLPGEAEGEHVAVRPDARILEEVPCAPEVASPLKDLIARPTGMLLFICVGVSYLYFKSTGIVTNTSS